MVEKGQAKPVVLVVEDEQYCVRAYVRYLKGIATENASTKAKAARLFKELPSVCGILLDEWLPDGSGLSWLAEVRADGWGGPVIVATGHYSAELTHAAHRLNAPFVGKPILPADLRIFACQAIVYGYFPRLATRTLVERLVFDWNLTVCQTKVLALASNGLSRCEIAEAIGISEETVKNHIHHVLEKSRTRSLEDFFRLLRGDTLWEDRRAAGMAPESNQRH